MSTILDRRAFLGAATLSAGAIALLKGGLLPAPARAQGELPPGTVHSFAKGGVRFHTYVSPAAAVSVTAHVVELADQLLLVDATMLPPTAAEVAALLASTGKPVGLAVLSHEHPDHWGAAAGLEGIAFSTLPAIRNTVSGEGEPWVQPPNVMDGPDLDLGSREMSGVPVEFRHYQNTEALDMIVTVLPEQKVAIVQDLLYNGVYAAPGMDRQNWIATLKTLRDDPAFETLLVGHGLPTTRGDLDTMIGYLEVFDQVMADAKTPDEAIAAMKQDYPAHSGEFLLSLITQYWAK
ncbi:MAG: MBL fold metallo-hydrolase [Pseudomonadota bacterium]